MKQIELETLSLLKSACRKYNDGTPDWEQRRYEIATAITAAIAEDILNRQYPPAVSAIICDILKVTDELIRQLKLKER